MVSLIAFFEFSTFANSGKEREAMKGIKRMVEETNKENGCIFYNIHENLDVCELKTMS